ncbi:circadian oscillating COP23 family protein [Lyngbya aestuarii BL J]|uniref:Circadian oscillating COP23 family protein n=1 Tax=Lyngbya aestuarii BL J TaxID=1348334 RepID=U7QAV2_9CYAN|nr:COP23 domain-containing protein [Lyngbya aestuarii]ERT04933.1 circadian oscillating COP23 family protein [Lyngbya aestuarii BL J]
MSSRLKSQSHLCSNVHRILSLSVSVLILLGFGSSAQARPNWTGGGRTPGWFPQQNDDRRDIRVPAPETNDTETELPQDQSSPAPDSTVNSPIPVEEIETETATEPRFRCEVIGGEYTVMYYPVTQDNQGFAWAVPGEMGGGWTPDRRCNEISSRLESYRPDGLYELLTGVENGYNVICATTEDVPSCRIVLTVPTEENPQLVRDRIFQNLVVADSGTATQAVYTLTDENSTGDIIQGIFRGGTGGNSTQRNRSRGINLKPFLAPEDRGTGTQLQSPNYNQ